MKYVTPSVHRVVLRRFGTVRYAKYGLLGGVLLWALILALVL
jgi:hypothetical protein